MSLTEEAIRRGQKRLHELEAHVEALQERVMKLESRTAPTDPERYQWCQCEYCRAAREGRKWQWAR